MEFYQPGDRVTVTDNYGSTRSGVIVEADPTTALVRFGSEYQFGSEYTLLVRTVNCKREVEK
jgi:hypothetical protein